MFTRALRIMLVMLTLGAVLHAGDIEGTVVIQRKLTKRKVTSSADPYQRGGVVELGSDQEQDPLAFERSHVVVYLEGDLPSHGVTAELDQQNRRFSPVRKPFTTSSRCLKQSRSILAIIPRTTPAS